MLVVQCRSNEKKIKPELEGLSVGHIRRVSVTEVVCDSVSEIRGGIFLIQVIIIVVSSLVYLRVQPLQLLD